MARNRPDLQKGKINNDAFERARAIFRERALEAFGETVEEEREELQEVADYVQSIILRDVLAAMGQDATPKEVSHYGGSWRPLKESWVDRKSREYRRNASLAALAKGNNSFFIGETGRTYADLKKWNTRRAWGRPTVSYGSSGSGDLRKGFFFDTAGRVQRRVTLKNGYTTQRFAKKADAFQAIIEIDLFPELGSDRKDIYKHLSSRTGSVLAILDQSHKRPLLEPFMRYNNEVELKRLVRLAIRGHAR